MVEDRGKGVEGDQSVPSSPEAVMSVRSGRSGGGRGTKRRREESTAISITDAGTEEEGKSLPRQRKIFTLDLTSPTAVTRQKRSRNTTTQRKASASVTPAASIAPKRRGGRWPKKEEKEESEEDEAEETESLDTASVADTDGGPVKGLRTSSRRRGAGDEKSETSASGRGGGRGMRARGRGGRARARGRGH